MMAMVTMCSTNLHGTLASDTGLYLAGSFCSPFLKAVVTWASFQSEGTTPVSMEDWTAYKSFVRPIFEYASTVRNPHTKLTKLRLYHEELPDMSLGATTTPIVSRTCSRNCSGLPYNNAAI